MVSETAVFVVELIESVGIIAISDVLLNSLQELDFIQSTSDLLLLLLPQLKQQVVWNNSLVNDLVSIIRCVYDSLSFSVIANELHSGLVDSAVKDLQQALLVNINIF